MAKSTEKTSEPNAVPSILWVVRIVSLIGLLLSGYLAWHSWHAGSQLLGCGEAGSGCEEVTQTRWSSWFGLPVSAAGFVVYAGIFLVSILLGKNQKYWPVLVFLTVLASGSALWFVLLQMFVVKSYCIYCMTVHACSITLGILLLLRTPRQTRYIMQAVFVGFVGLAILIGGQVLEGRGFSQPETQTSSGDSTQTQTAPATPGQSQEIESHTVSLLNGKFSIDVGAYPMIGSPKAPRVVAHFFDYTCPACRQLHPNLIAAQQKFENEVALVLIPLPLDAQCNPGIQETAYQHQNACLFAHMGIAIWHLHPELYKKYDEFMFHSEFPPSAEQAVTFAYQLVGRETLNAAMTVPNNGELLRHGIDLFYSPVVEKKVLPIVITSQEAIYGIPKVDDLSSYYTSQFK